MKLGIQIELENSAFDEEGGYAEEVRRILDKLCDRLPPDKVCTEGRINLYDANGNRVGWAAIGRGGVK